MKRKRNYINNKGFSLIELIVTVLITSVLMIGVIAFLSTSRSAYQNVAVSSTLQEETITIKRILSEYMTEAKRYGFQKNVNIDGSSGDVTVLWVVARDTESNSNPDVSYFFALDLGDKKLRYCTGDAALCPENQTVLSDDAKTQIANECFKTPAKMKYSVIGEHVESMEKGGVAQRYDGTDLVAIKMVYRYPDGSGPKYNDEITVVTRNRLRATPTPTPKPTPTPLPPAPTGGGGSTPTPTPTTEPTGGATATPSPTPTSTPTPTPAGAVVDLSSNVGTPTFDPWETRSNGKYGGLKIPVSGSVGTSDWEFKIKATGGSIEYFEVTSIDYRLSAEKSGDYIVIKNIHPDAYNNYYINGSDTITINCVIKYTGTLSKVS